MNLKNVNTGLVCKGLCGAVIGLGLQACASNPVDERKPENSALPAIEKPGWVAGTTHKRVNRVNGEDSSWTIKSIAPNGNITAESSSGCLWTVQADWFAPTLAWENCGKNPSWQSGTRTIDKQQGEIWPLAVGNKVTYTHSYESSTGEKSNNVDTCKVLGVVQIDTSYGALDTFKIRCRRSWDSSYQDRIWYWSPEHRDVKYMRIHSNDGLKSHSDGLSLEIPGA